MNLRQAWCAHVDVHEDGMGGKDDTDCTVGTGGKDDTDHKDDTGHKEDTGHKDCNRVGSNHRSAKEKTTREINRLIKMNESFSL